MSNKSKTSTRASTKTTVAPEKSTAPVEATTDTKAKGDIATASTPPTTPPKSKVETKAGVTTVQLDKLNDTDLDTVLTSKANTVPGTEANLQQAKVDVNAGVKTRAAVEQYKGTSSDAEVAEIAEKEATEISSKVNDRLPNKVAPESVDNRVKVNQTIARATSFNPDTRPGEFEDEQLDKKPDPTKVNLQHNPPLNDTYDQPFSSTETPQLDEIPVPVEDTRRPSAEEQRMRHHRRNRNPILGNSSTQPIISRDRKVNVFKNVALNKSTRTQSTPMLARGARSMVDHIVATTGVSSTHLRPGTFLGELITDLNLYVKVMSPRSPTSAEQVKEQQGLLIASIQAIFEQPTDTGVLGLRILEEFFRVYQAHAMRGELPLRAFNEFSPEQNKLANIIYTIQSIAVNGRDYALREVSIPKLRESLQTQEAQNILISYLHQEQE